jgi:hypothetical protein
VPTLDPELKQLLSKYQKRNITSPQEFLSKKLFFMKKVEGITSFDGRIRSPCWFPQCLFDCA